MHYFINYKFCSQTISNAPPLHAAGSLKVESSAARVSNLNLDVGMEVHAGERGRGGDTETSGGLQLSSRGRRSRGTGELILHVHGRGGGEVV